MAGLSGPFALTPANVARVSASPGVYILSTDGRFACYVGRSGSLRDRLQSYIGGRYGYFFLKYHDTEEGAFFTECRLFHLYGKARHLDNQIHPARPAGSSLPACGEPGCRGEAY